MVINAGTVRKPKKKCRQFEYLLVLRGNEDDFKMNFQNRLSQNCAA